MYYYTVPQLSFTRMCSCIERRQFALAEALCQHQIALAHHSRPMNPAQTQQKWLPSPLFQIYLLFRPVFVLKCQSPALPQKFRSMIFLFCTWYFRGWQCQWPWKTLKVHWMEELVKCQWVQHFEFGAAALIFKHHNDSYGAVIYEEREIILCADKCRLHCHASHLSLACHSWSQCWPSQCQSLAPPDL